MSPTRVLLTATAAGTAAALLITLDRPGLGWPLTAALVFVLLGGRVTPVWATLSTALFAVSAITASEWLFTLCATAGCAAASLAVVGGRTARGLVFGMAAVPGAAFRAIPWLAKHLKQNGAPRTRPALITLALLTVFVPLLAGADPTFAGLLTSLLPHTSAEPVLLFTAVALGTLGACHLLVVPVVLDDDVSGRRRIGRREWVLPVGALVVLFAAFVAVQVATLFGGDDHVRTTADLTYAQYARSGFWQLLAVTVLTLAVIGTVAYLAAPEDHRPLRLLLGALGALTLVIVASALTRMWLYQQAYGFTVLRVLVSAFELWLGVVYLLVLAAGVRMAGAWLPRAVLACGFVALLGLAALNPDRFIAERNVARWQETGRIDASYLGRLSDDAVPALLVLPDDLRVCRDHPAEDDWRTWNLGRERARRALAERPVSACSRR
ncbi:DUF4153 domain-containing protein [Saccharothrix syringae]|uniref:DUF4173 domain-containing protein n=1 Tax=Saccharothrix syringae TaxID=103733 RepID=A0A5Q0HAX6_SACSY|nr:DUF4173 domain-containing protein [Saccharothrix syringae]QFZ23083.1 DUF4173 domain-containing protein [Saccharothrix syringae]